MSFVTAAATKPTLAPCPIPKTLISNSGNSFFKTVTKSIAS